MNQVGTVGEVGPVGAGDEVDRVEADVSEDVELDTEAGGRPHPPHAADTGCASPPPSGSIPPSLCNPVSQKRRLCRERPG